jgi:hypothetical protein
VAGWAHFCNSRARPASKCFKRLNPLNRPGHGTGFGSPSCKTPVSEGYLQSKDLQTRIFSQFSVFRPCASLKRPRAGISAFLKFQAEDHTVARCKSSPPSKTNSRCGNRVEILWDARVDATSAARYVCKVSRTVGFALDAIRLIECAPLRRIAIRSLTTRLNVPVVRERIQA